MNMDLGISETALRFGIFLGIFAIMATLELLLPRRKLNHSKGSRWFTNLAFAGIDGLIVRLMALFVVPLAAVATAFWAQNKGFGLFNVTDWPAWLEITLAIILLDMAIYVQHVVSHLFPPLWRLHKVHHTDVDFDVTTAVRFHPIEIALSMLWKMIIVVELGADPLAVVLFEVILNGCATFNHSNVTLPGPLDRIIRTLFVTPDMHRVHHSIYGREHNSNYGFNLSIWDRLFRTYTDQPEDGHVGMTIGLREHQNEKPTGLVWSLALPFQNPESEAKSEEAEREIT